MKTTTTPRLRYKKYDWKQLHTIDQKTLEAIAKTDTLYRRTVTDLKDYIFRSKINADKTIIYLCYRGEELAGTVFGNLKPVSEFYNKDHRIKASPEDKMFSLTSFTVRSEFQNQGIGTKLMARVYADQRAKHNSKFIYMVPVKKTQNINKKLTGNKPLFIPISRTQKANKRSIAKKQFDISTILKIKKATNSNAKKKMFRNFEHSRFRYDLLEAGTTQNVVINKNPKYKRKPISRRKPIRRSVAK